MERVSVEGFDTIPLLAFGQLPRARLSLTTEILGPVAARSRLSHRAVNVGRAAERPL
jgi:hypothetical protein